MASSRSDSTSEAKPSEVQMLVIKCTRTSLRHSCHFSVHSQKRHRSQGRWPILTHLALYYLLYGKGECVQPVSSLQKRDGDNTVKHKP